jgi:chromosome segregation ATPase
MALTDQDKSELAALFAAASQQVTDRLDAFEQEAATRFGRLEDAVRELTARTSVVVEAILGLQNEVAALRSRVDKFSTELIEGRTRDIDRLAKMERRIEALEEQLRAGKDR